MFGLDDFFIRKKRISKAKNQDLKIEQYNFVVQFLRVQMDDGELIFTSNLNT